MNGGKEEAEVEELVEEARQLISRLSGIDDTEATLRFLAWLNTVALRYGGRVVITGGFAVEVYSGRAYRTLDVDIVVESPPKAR